MISIISGAVDTADAPNVSLNRWRMERFVKLSTFRRFKIVFAVRASSPVDDEAVIRIAA